MKRRYVGALAAMGVMAPTGVLILSPLAGAQTSAPTLSVVADQVSSTRGCIVTNTFPRGDVVVFRATADLNGALDPNAQLTVHIVNGPTLPMKLGSHPPGSPKAVQYWTATWPVPLTAAPGVVDWSVTAVDPQTGATGTFQPFPVPPSMMTIVPATYAVTVSVTANQHPATTVTPGQPLTIVARVGRTVETGPNQTAFVPLTTGSVTATVGPEAALSEQGQLKQGHSVALQYDPASQTWTGTAATDDLSPGFYVVQVQAADTVTPPNTGTGNSAIFAVNQAPTPASPKTYTVQRGDTLWGIAARLLGSGARWPTLYQLNRARIGPNPNLIRPGLVLEVP